MTKLIMLLLILSPGCAWFETRTGEFRKDVTRCEQQCKAKTPVCVTRETEDSRDYYNCGCNR